MADPDWLRLNQANWDERVRVHRAAPMYDGSRLRDGTARLHAIEEAELGSVAGLRVLHLQCHFGQDSLILAQRGAAVTGIDFSPPAVEAARADAAALGLSARFVLSDVYGAPEALPEPASFDLVFTSWGTICWHPDLRRWAEVIAFFLRPGGRFYYADMHPAAAVFHDDTPGVDGRPGWSQPYFQLDGFVEEDPTDYADPQACLQNKRTVQFIHPLANILASLMAAGLRLEWLHEHDRMAWQQYKCLVRGPDGCWTWPDRPWLPLGLSLSLRRDDRTGLVPKEGPSWIAG
ncbi:MAG: class I SAM-dependent methyltransferase [Acetobacteraceae bacterium]|nr:class I SAM-dependent methyltransferase [Acetobacteraceae bacterium]